MLRLTPANSNEKIISSKQFEVNYAGAESNVASSLGILKNKVNFVTKLPENRLGDAALCSLQNYGIGTNHIIRGGNRIGTYFIEVGSSIRPSNVTYDRSGSSISEIKKNELNWKAILTGKKWLFLSGITPVLSNQCAKETVLAAKTAKELGVKVGFDMNYRRSLWKSPNDAKKLFDKILEYTDILFCNSGVLKDVYKFNIIGQNALDQALNSSTLANYKFGIHKIALTIREHISASKNNVSGLLAVDGEPITSDYYKVAITDRFGTGDAFVAAFLHGANLNWDNKKVLDFATAAFALKHTIKGDQHTSNEKEIFSIMGGNISGHVVR